MNSKLLNSLKNIIQQHILVPEQITACVVIQAFTQKSTTVIRDENPSDFSQKLTVILVRLYPLYKARAPIKLHSDSFN